MGTLPKSKQILITIKKFIHDWFVIITFFAISLFAFLSYFDYPTELNLSKAKTHIGKVVDIEITMPKFGRQPYHNSDSCFIHFENLDGTKEKLVAKNCTHKIIPKIWKAKEIKIYATPIFGMHFIYQISNDENRILYKMAKSELLEMGSDKLYILQISIITFLFALYCSYVNLKEIKLKNKEKK